MLKDRYEQAIFFLGGLLSVSGIFLPMVLSFTLYIVVGIFLILCLYLHKKDEIQTKIDIWSIVPFIFFASLAYVSGDDKLAYVFGYLSLFFLAWVGVSITTFIPDKNKLDKSKNEALNFMRRLLKNNNQDTNAIRNDHILAEQVLRTQEEFKLKLREEYGNKFQELQQKLAKAQQEQKSSRGLENKIKELEDYINKQANQLLSQEEIVKSLNIKYTSVLKEASNLKEKQKQTEEELQKSIETSKNIIVEKEQLTNEYKKLQKEKADTDKIIQTIKELEEEALAVFGITKKEIFNKEIRYALEQAIINAKFEIAIVSPFVNYNALFASVVFDKTLSELFRDALKRNVTIKIHYGMDNNSGKKDDTQSSLMTARKNIKKLRRYLSPYDTKFSTKEGNDHSKVLIVDRKYLMTGSFNYLGFDGAYKKDNRGESASISIDQDKLKEQYERFFNFN